MEEKEKQMPELEEVKEEEVEVKPNYEEGLKAILASNNIDEIKAIAQSLLQEEETEEKEQPQMDEVSMQDYLGGK